MKTKTKNNGSVFLIIVFAIAMLTMITVGIVQMTTEELQLMKNQLYSAQAKTIAEAGLNDAFAQIRTASNWTPNASYTSKSFSISGVGYTGTYTVTVAGTPAQTITSTATSSQGYTAKVIADVNVSGSNPNNVIRINKLRVNE